MQTFLPLPDFAESASVLDRQMFAKAQVAIPLHDLRPAR